MGNSFIPQHWLALGLSAGLCCAVSPAWAAISTPDGLLPDTLSSSSSEDLSALSTIGEQARPLPGRPSIEGAEPTEAGVGFYTYNYLYAPNSGRQSYFFSNTAFFNGESTGPIFQAKADFEGVVIEKPATTWTIEAPEAYVATSPQLSDTVQVKLGRELHSWNHLDEEFQMGIWEPRFRWDYVHPQSVGLAGVHVDVSTDDFQFTAFGSPVFVPDRGIPIEFQNNGIYSINPYFVSPATTLSYEGVPTSVNYGIEQPSLNSILFHPGGSLMARVGKRKGAWGSAGYAFMPMNQLLFSYSGQYNAAVSQQVVDATLYPRVAYHQLASVETGYEGGWFSAWISGLEDRPIDNAAVLGDDTQVVTMAHSVGPSFEVRTGDLKYAPTRFRISGMKTWGGNAPDNGPDATGYGSVFENRYFSHAAAVFYTESPLGFIGLRHASASYRLLGDIEHDGKIQSVDIYYTFMKSWVVNLGGDLLSSAEAANAPDAISEYRADSRVRMGVSYVF